MPGTEIGNNCVIGAGSVVRGKIPDESVVMGNPAKIIMKTSLYRKMVKNNKNCLNADVYSVENEEKKDKVVKLHFLIEQQ